MTNSKILFFFLFSSLLFAQKSFFIKFKDGVDRKAVEQKVASLSFLPDYMLSEKSTKQPEIKQLAGNLSNDISTLKNVYKFTVYSTIGGGFIESVVNGDNDIEYLEECHIYKVDGIPNDSLFSQQWALRKIGAVDAWNYTTGKSDIIVGVIDTGIDFLHPDLAGCIYQNPGETGTDANGNDKRYNRIDDDGNGMIDDYMGWDFVDRVGFPFDTTAGDYLNWDNYPMDENGYSHGTAVCGIIAAQKNNTIGIAGVAPGVKVLNLRAFDPLGNGEEDDVAAAILYAVKMGVKVINMSFGDYSYSHVLRDVIKYAYSKNIVMVASSGNSNSKEPHYPSGYSEVISVGNSTSEDYVASSSNYGSTLDLVAPGTSIETTMRGYSYGEFNGTSAAAPFASAAAALVLSRTDFTNEEVKHILKTTADDINPIGWDERSGSGRLNVLKAVTVLPAGKILLNFPTQDYTVTNNLLPIVVTALSPAYESADVSFGMGTNPLTWIPIKSNIKNQFSADTITVLNLSSYPDTVYTARLSVTLNTGQVVEERCNFHIIRSATKGEVVSIIPAYYGDKATIMAALYSYKNAVGRMYYREYGTSTFTSISLDGFSSNNQFVKQVHYGFIPKTKAKANTIYEIYFEIENSGGFKTILKDSTDYFVVSTGGAISPINKTELPYTLPAGTIFDKPLDITGTDSHILLRESDSPTITHFYKFANNEFTKVLTDSLNNKIAKDYGDFNKDSFKDILSLWSYTAIIDKQVTSGTTNFTQAVKSDSSFFWPIGVKDLMGDGNYELLALTSSTVISVYKIESNLSLAYLTKFSNYSDAGYGGNEFNSPNAVLADIDNDGKSELWMVDADGDLISWNINSTSSITPKSVIQTGYTTSTAYLTSGDFNNDGKADLAVILQSISEVDIAPYNRLMVFNLNSGKMNTLYDNAFVDPTSEYRLGFQKALNTIKFVDVDNDGKSELLFFVFPYSYIVKYGASGSQIISYIENVNSNSILAADFNKDGVIDIAYPFNDKIKFYQYGTPNRTSPPQSIEGYSIDESHLLIKWQAVSGASKYYIYKGASATELSLFDSTANSNYNMQFVGLSKTLYFYVVAKNLNKINPISAPSEIIAVYHHKPAVLSMSSIETANSVQLHYDEKIRPTIDGLNFFKLFKLDTSNNIVDTLSISSVAPFDQYGYLVSTTKPFGTGKYKLYIDGLTDLYNSPIKSDSTFLLYSESPKESELYIVSFTIDDSYHITLNFSMDLNSQAATDKKNYIITPNIDVKSVLYDSKNPKSVILDLTGSKPIGAVGIEYKLNVQNLKSSVSTGSIAINTGAGSVIILNKYAENLDNVYTYPSPVKLSSTETVMFAELPKNVTIDIISITGEHIASISNNEGNGGFTWDLRDIKGNKVSSGVYIYRVIMKDSENKETASKLGKMVVIK